MDTKSIEDQSNLNQEILNNRKKYLDDLIKRRYFYSLGSEIYGGVAGLYDYGPVGCAIKNNMLRLWREHFILEEDMLEISTTCITPEPVFKASGHLDRFTDLIVRDVKTQAGFRADKLLETFIENKLSNKKKPLPENQVKELLEIKAKAETYSSQELHQVFQKLQVKSPDTGNDLTEPEPFNLMFGTPVGPSGQLKGFLRPETAQGMFVNFNKLLEFNAGKVPFAAAQIGLGFRNEIAPRNGLYRVREFDMAEIEHFFDPLKPQHPKFKYIKNLEIPLLTADNQENNSMQVVKCSLEQAVLKGMISNETHAYFMGRTYLFLIEVGVNKNNIRFRQHMRTEMAHYACDCWDAEIEFSHGYRECVGIANRSAFDLKQHSDHSGTKLLAARRLPEQREVTVIDLVLDKKDIFKVLKADGTLLTKHIEGFSEEQKNQLMEHFKSNDTWEVQLGEKKLSLAKNQVEFKISKQIQIEEKFIPYVIEPSFGIGRIFSAILEHSFRMRDEKRTFLHLPAKVAPIKCSILPVISHEKYDDSVLRLKQGLTKVGISSKVDDSGQAIGRRYARTDELGIPFGITVDNDTLTDDTVTLREILTCKQVRIKLNEVFEVLKNLSDGLISWDNVLEKYPLFQPAASEKNE